MYNKSSTAGTYGIFLSEISHTPVTYNYDFGKCISNKFISSIGSYVELANKPGNIQTYITSSGANRVAYSFNSADITSVAQAQTKIGEGFEVQYVLSEPIEETIDIPDLYTYNGYNKIGVDSSIKPSAINVQYWKLIGE